MLPLTKLPTNFKVIYSLIHFLFYFSIDLKNNKKTKQKSRSEENNLYTYNKHVLILFYIVNRTIWIKDEIKTKQTNS